MKVKFDKFIYALAPMAGTTDPIFTQIMSVLGADMTTTEMISIKALQHASLVTKKMIDVKKQNSIKCIQFFGHDVNSFSDVLQNLDLKKFDVVDLNCGCPAPKIVNNLDGCSMMKNISNTANIVATIKRITKKPVSVKFRLGIDNNLNFIEFAKAMENSGADFLILHARTREQQYSGNVNSLAYKQLVDAVNIPVIWSGDIKDVEDINIAKSMGVKGVMIGRKAITDPFIFFKLKRIDYLNDKKIYKKLQNFFKIDKKIKFFDLGTEERKKLLLKSIINYHLNALLNYFKNSTDAVNYFKKQLAGYLSNIPNISKLRAQIYTTQNLEQMQALISSL